MKRGYLSRVSFSLTAFSLLFWWLPNRSSHLMRSKIARCSVVDHLIAGMYVVASLTQLFPPGKAGQKPKKHVHI